MRCNFTKTNLQKKKNGLVGSLKDKLVSAQEYCWWTIKKVLETNRVCGLTHTVWRKMLGLETRSQDWAPSAAAQTGSQIYEKFCVRWERDILTGRQRDDMLLSLSETFRHLSATSNCSWATSPFTLCSCKKKACDPVVLQSVRRRALH